MSTPLIHTQVARRDGEDVWFTFTLSRMPDTRWKLHFCLARHIDPDSLQGGELERQSGSYKVSVRTSEGIDASKVCEALGGGGHVRAAGCEFFGNLENAKAAVLEEVAKQI